MLVVFFRITTIVILVAHSHTLSFSLCQSTSRLLKFSLSHFCSNAAHSWTRRLLIFYFPYQLLLVLIYGANNVRVKNKSSLERITIGPRAPSLVHWAWKLRTRPAEKLLGEVLRSLEDKSFLYIPFFTTSRRIISQCLPDSGSYI